MADAADAAPGPHTPAISVALCTRDGARFIAAQIASIGAQTVAVAELVISDDASSDDTVERARNAAAAAGLAASVVVNDPPLGVTGNFEAAVVRTTGALIALADQDDAWHPDKLQRAVAALAEPAALLVHTDARLVDADGAPLGATLFEQLEVSEAELGLEESGRGIDAVLRRNLATGATVVFRRELLEAALPFPPEWVHDEWLAVIAAALGGLRVLRAPTVDYRQHGRNEIGVAEPTLARKVSRVVREPRGGRNRELAAKFAVLARRLDELGDAVPETVRQAARQKAEFEQLRAAMPDARLRRLGSVVRLARRGLYPRFASRGRLDVLRDLLQPA